MLPVPAGGNVCCVLKRSSDSRVRTSVSRPRKRAVMNTQLPQFSDFIRVNAKVYDRMPPCAASPRAAAAMEEDTHTSTAALRGVRDTSRARVQVIEPLVACRVAQVFDPCYLLPSTHWRGGVSFRRLSRVRSVYRESCAWSCGLLSRLLLRSPCHRCHHPERRSWGVRGMRWSVL